MNVRKSGYHKICEALRLPARVCTFQELAKAYKNRLALTNACEVGLDYVYMENVPEHLCENNYCPYYQELLIKCLGFAIEKRGLTEDTRCPACGYTFAVRGQFNPRGFAYPCTLI